MAANLSAPQATYYRAIESRYVNGLAKRVGGARLWSEADP